MSTLGEEGVLLSLDAQGYFGVCHRAGAGFLSIKGPSLLDHQWHRVYLCEVKKYSIACRSDSCLTPEAATYCLCDLGHIALVFPEL